MLEQEVYNAENGAPPASVNDHHIACALLLDASSSMLNLDAIGKLNEAVERFKRQCSEDDALRRSLDIAIVSFATKVEVLQDFSPVTEMTAPHIEANGQTSMGLGLNTAIDLLERRKAQYREIGVPYFRPWIFMISDGAPNDDWEPAFKRVNEMQMQNKLELWAVGVPGYDARVLTSLTKRVIALDDSLQFASLFEWLKNSLSRKSQSKPGDSVQYENLPDGSRVVPSDWG